MPQFGTRAGRRIRFVSHQALPNDPVELGWIVSVLFTEVQPLGFLLPPGGRVGGMWQVGGRDRASAGKRQGRGVEDLRRSRRIRPARRSAVFPAIAVLVDIKGVGHGGNARIVNAEVGDTKDILDGAQHANGVVGVGYHRALLHVGAQDEGKAAISADVVSAILRIVFDDEY